MNENGMRFMP